ncbi:unnamed protein product [Caenorhabditis angaria]|uniref:BIG2 domain-containing protein n=1 Tax=Caenorhabditis angaria TaxID=860376 RepID=A0A9P1I7C3_9PELO|nr:unnamed protein product [Caenorhabditis angaria]
MAANKDENKLENPPESTKQQKSKILKFSSKIGSRHRTSQKCLFSFSINFCCQLLAEKPRSSFVLKMMISSSWTWLFLLAGCTNLSAGYRLNVPRVLLPYHPNIPVHFILEVTHPSGGCFNWRSTRPDVVSVKSITNSSSTCSDRAEIRSVVKSDAIGLTDTSSVIFAEDRASGTTLSCGVTVDQIATISIETTTKVLFVDAAPARMTVDAFNAEGDRFSTLSEISLEWELSSSSAKNNNKPLRIVPFEQSTYEAPEEIVKLEKNRKRGSLILIEGVGTGTSSLTAKFSDSFFKHVEAHKVDLIVVANLLLVPSQDMYIPVHSILPFQVLLVKQHGTEVVPMPSDNYELSVDSDKIIAFDRKTTSIRALTRGNSGVFLVNSHIDVETKAGLRPPSTNIHVVDVESIQWYVSGDNWILETGKQYTFTIEMFDENRNNMFLSDNSVFETFLDPALFQIDFISKNKTWIVATPQKPAKTVLTSKFVGLYDSNGKLQEQVRKISGEQKVVLVEPIRIIPSIVYLPYVSNNQKKSEILLEATGGSGIFSWSVENLNIASVDSNGKVIANNLGTTIVKVTDLRNQALEAQADVFVLDVNGIGFGESVRETFVGHDLILNLRVFGQDKHEMSDCRNIDFRVEVADSTILRHSNSAASIIPKIGTGCGTVTLKGIVAGDTRVTVSIGPHKATIDVSVYNALTVSDEEISIGLESGYSTKLLGGPRPWALDTSAFYRKESGNSKIAINFDESNVVIKCSGKEISENVVVQIGNEVTPTLPFPVKSEITLTICCTSPTKLEIFENVQKLEKCPNNIHTLKSRSTSKLSIRGYGVCSGKMTQLHSINGIKAKWTSSDKNILKIGKISTEGADISSLQQGTATISASYAKSEAKYEILVFDSLKSEPNQLTIWNEPVSEGLFLISGGSGFFNVENSGNGAGQAKLALTGRNLNVSPKKEGNLNLRIVDQCVSGQYIDVVVKIVDIKSLRIIAPQYVEIGQEIEVECIAQDENGGTIKNAYLPLKQANLEATNNHVFLKRNDGLKWNIRADSIGSVSLSVSATNSAGKQLHSKPHTLQIFAPIYLQPKRLVLIPESQFQLEVVGGPQPTPPLSFKLNNSEVAAIQPNALITSKELGYTEILGTVLVGDGHVTKDSVVVRVVSLAGVVLSSSTRKVEVGGRIDVRLKGIVAGGSDENEEPFAFGGAIYPFKVTWSVSDPTILQNTHPLGNDISESNENQFAIWFDATRSGMVTIKATVEINSKAYKHFIGRDTVFNAEIDIIVEDSVGVVNPEMKLNMIRMAPNSNLQLVTSWSNAHFSVPSEYSNKVSVSKDGLIHSNGREGSVIITAKKVDSSDNETAIIPVAVSRVYSLDVSPTLELRSSFGTSPLLHLPVGAQIQFKIIARDVRGRVLSSTSTNINYRPHRFDLTDITAIDNNHTLTITLKSAGDTVLRISDASNEKISTFIRISASESLLPPAAFKYPNDLVVSDVFCLKSNLLSEDGLKWSSKSSNDGAINWLDEQNGVAQLSQPGDTFIKLQSGKQTIHSKIVINSPQILRFSSLSNPNLVTNEESTSFIFPVIAGTNETTQNKHSSIYGDCSKEQIASFSQSFVPFECHVSFARGRNAKYPAVNWLVANAIFAENIGFGCEVRRLEAAFLQGIPEELEKQQWNVEVVAKWKLEENHVKEARIAVPFHFAMSVEKKELVFSNMVDTGADLSIWAPKHDLDHVTVRGCEGDILTIHKLRNAPTNSPTKSNIFYQITLNVKSAALFSDFARKCQISVENTQTGQIIRVPVSIQLLDETAKQVYEALESRGFFDVLIVLFKQNSGLLSKMLWTCAIAIILLAVGIYMKVNLSEKSGSFGDTTMNNSTLHQTSIASSLGSTFNTSGIFRDSPQFRSTPIAGSPSLIQSPRDRLRTAAHLGSAGDSRLWTSNPQRS